jgi:hypothetical protein
MEKRIFIMKDSIKYYKTDSFWSLSKNPEHAKRHYCITEELLKNLNHVLNYDEENTVEKYPFYKNALIGYEDPETNEVVITNQIVADGNKYKITTGTRENKLKRILKNE